MPPAPFQSKWARLVSVDSRQILQVELTSGLRYTGQAVAASAPGRPRVAPQGGGEAREFAFTDVVRMALIDQGSLWNRLDGYLTAGYDDTKANNLRTFTFTGRVASVLPAWVGMQAATSSMGPRRNAWPGLPQGAAIFEAASGDQPADCGPRSTLFSGPVIGDRPRRSAGRTRRCRLPARSGRRARSHEAGLVPQGFVAGTRRRGCG